MTINRDIGDIFGSTTIAKVRGATAGNTVIIASQLETASADVALTDAATVAVDWDAGINFTLTLTVSRILGNPTNPQPGTWRNVLVTANSLGTSVLTFGNQYVFPGGAVPVLSTAASSKNRLIIYCRTSTIFEAYMTGTNIS